MPDDTTAETETVDIAEYKKLQRKFNRVQKENSSLKADVQEVRSTNGRIETDLEGILTYFARQDPEAKPVIDNYLQQRKGQKEYDTTSAQTSRRLSELLDEHDEDWEDDKFSQARARLAAAADDPRNFEETVRMVQQILAEPASHPASVDDVRSIVKELMEKGVSGAAGEEGAETRRVDTGASSTTAPSRVSRASLDVDPSKTSHTDMIALRDAALEQMSS